MSKYLLGLVLLCALGCSSSSIKINSNPPGADVYIKAVGKSDRKQIGKTPLVQTSLNDMLKGPVSGAVYIELEKENYYPATILITEVGSANLEVSQELKAIVKDAKNTDAADLNKGLEQLFEAQRLARVGRLDDALKALDEVGKNYPQLAPVPEMKAGIFYLQKDYRKALDEYRKTLVLNSENISAQQMIKRLEARTGGKHTEPSPSDLKSLPPKTDNQTQ